MPEEERKAHDEIAERDKRLRLTAQGKQSRLAAPAPWARQNAVEHNTVLPESLSRAAGVRAALLAQIALGGAIVEPEARRIAVAA